MIGYLTGQNFNIFRHALNHHILNHFVDTQLELVERIGHRRLDNLFLLQDRSFICWKKRRSHCQGQDDLAVFVAFVSAAEEATDTPDEVGKLGVGFRAHGVPPCFFRSSLYTASPFSIPLRALL